MAAQGANVVQHLIYMEKNKHFFTLHTVQNLQMVEYRFTVIINTSSMVLLNTFFHVFRVFFLITNTTFRTIHTVALTIIYIITICI